ncbi:hypothetical protein [Pseudoalteromonas marina]|uniref:hypothetical protein n=1 Tax=Pseudoalteromonas marina TaxID=267375 RepID=UPI0023F52E0C|nr:hypothetical protein [Pseudoalteromonas marina]
MFNKEIIGKIKSIQIGFLPGISIGRVIATRLYDTSVKSIAIRVIHALFYQSKFTIIKEDLDADTLVFHGCKYMNRPDYDIMVGELQSKLSNRHDYMEVTEHFSLLSVFYNIYHALKVFSAVRGLNFFRKMYVSILFSHYIAAHGYIKGIDLKRYKHLVTFCDAHGYDSLMTQISKGIGLKTYTLQHGQYKILKSNYMADAEAYENFISDKMFVWGQATIDEFLKFGFDESRFAITGWLKERPQIIKAKVPVFGVLLSGDNIKVNRKLISIAVNLSDRINETLLIRMHPKDSIENYIDLLHGNKSFFTTLSEEAFYSKVRFNISYMTGAFLDSIAYDVPCYIYENDMLSDIFRIDGLNFSSVDNLLILLSNAVDKKNDIANYFLAPISKNIKLN